MITQLEQLAIHIKTYPTDLSKPSIESTDISQINHWTNNIVWLWIYLLYQA